MADEDGQGRPAGFDHPAWRTAGATVGGYIVLLAVLTALLFGVPYLLFSWF